MTGINLEMSYARWSSDSNWYAFWCDSTDDTPQSEEVLCLWHKTKHIVFTFKELANIGCGPLMNLYPNVSDDDIIKAMLIIKMFQNDVKNLQDDMK